MPIAFTTRLRPSPDVLITQTGGEAVLLDLRTEKYFGLDDVGSRMWAQLTGGGTVQEAYGALLREYAVDPDVLRRDLDRLVDRLVGLGLLRPDPA